MSDKIPLCNYHSLTRLCLFILLFLTTSGLSAQSGFINTTPVPEQPSTQNLTFTPGNNCILWFKADEYDTASLSQIPVLHDFSGNNHHAVQPTGSRQPLFIPNGFGSKPAIRFDGIDDYLNTQVSVTGNKLTAFFIIKVLSYTTYSGFITLYNSTETQDWNTPSALVIALNVPNPGLGGTRNYYFYGYTSTFLNISSINSIMLRNDSTLTSSNKQIYSKAPSAWSLNSTHLNIGSRWENNSPFRFGNFEFAELIVYDTSISSVQWQETYDYLYNKYSAPKISLGSNILQSYSFCPIIFSLDSTYASYEWSTGATTPEVTITEPGSYWVKVKDPVFGFYSSDTVEISMPGLVMPDLVMCPGDSIPLTTGFTANYTFKWGDLQNDSLSGDPDFLLTKPGTYMVRVTDSLGCSVADTFSVLPDPFSTAVQFGTDTLMYCEDDSLSVQLPAGTGYQYHWNTGSANPGIRLQTEGWYALTVTNNAGCRSADSVYIRFKGYKPIAWFSIQDSVCLGTQILVQDSSYLHPNDTSSLIQQYAWTYNQTPVSTSSTASFTVQQAFQNNIHLQIVTTAGCVSEISRYIFGVPAPDVQFYTNTGCTGVPVCFSDQSTSLISPISIRNWNFGDPQSGNNTSSDSAVCHTYLFNGSFQAILTVGNIFGCSDSLGKTINIHQSPDVGFIYLDSCSSETIQFIDTTTYESWNPCLQRIWNWGDGTTDTVPNPVHKFPGPGSYNISLDIKSLQCLNRYIRTVLIKPVPLSLFNAQDVCEGVPVEFTNLSYAPGDTILESQWIFDSLGVSSLTNPSFLFPEPGNFTVNLSVTTASNCTHDTSFVIQVFTRPTSGFDYTITPQDPEFEVCFTNQSVNATTYLWNFGDNQFSSLPAPCHIYPTGDTFTVTLHAINSALCADSIQKKLFVDSPFMDLILKDFTLESKNDRLLLNLSLSNNSNRFWEDFYVQIEQDGQQFLWLEIDTILPPYSDFTIEREIPGIHLFNTTHKYYCVTTGNQNIFEPNMNNNSLCKLNVVAPELLSYTIVENIITLSFIVPDIDIFYLKLYSLDGNLVQSHEYNNIKSGIVDLQYSTFGIQSGIYIIEYNTKSFMRNFKIFIN